MDIQKLMEERAEVVASMRKLQNGTRADDWGPKETAAWDRADAREKELTRVISRERRMVGLEEMLTEPDSELIKHPPDAVYDRYDDDSKEVRALRHDETCVRYLERRGRLRDRERYRGLTPGAYLRAMILGPRSEVERRALAGGTDSAGGHTVPDFLAADLIDRMRAQSHVLRAGAQLVPLESDSHKFAKVNADPTVSWRAENAAVAESEPTFLGVTFAPKSAAFLTKTSRELIEDSINLEEALPRLFATVMAEELDRVALLGSGSSNEPTGVRNMSGATEVSMGTNGAALTNYDEIVDLIQALEDANAPTPSTAIMAPRTWAEIAKLKDTANQPLQPPPGVEDLTLLRSSKIPVDETQGTATDASTLYTGAWDQLWIGVRTEVTVEVLKERYADNLQFGYLSFMRLDIQASHEAALGRLIGIIP